MPDRLDERFRWAVEASPSGMIIVDRSGGIVLANSKACDIFGYSHEELIGQRIEQLIPEQHRDLHADDRDRYMEHPRTRAMGVGRDFIGLRKDGTEFPVEIGLAPIQEEGPLLTLASVIDITERKRAEEAAQRNQRDLERLIYVISHDLQQPLRAIDGFAQFLEEDYGSQLDDTGRDYIARIRRASDHIGKLLRDLLRLSQARAMGDHRETVQGRDLVQQVLDMLEEEIERTKASVRIDETLPVLRLEPTWAMHALENLVANALRFHRPGHVPEVEITGFVGKGEDGTLAGFIVSDRGPGIPEDQMDRIFELFQRGTVRDVPGTGAGLAIAREVAERSGGWCRARNRDGGGAEFTLCFGSQQAP